MIRITLFNSVGNDPRVVPIKLAVFLLGTTQVVVPYNNYLFSLIIFINLSNKNAVSSGPPQASGWNCTENAGISV